MLTDPSLNIKEELVSQTYIGIKIVKAEPMDQISFLTRKGGDTDYQGENSLGYKVTYDDGYESWSPKEVFERCYRPISNSEKILIK